MRPILLLSILFTTACAAEEGDPSMYLTGTEESYVTNAQTGAKECLGKKVLICHVPPGNPDNAHTICVGKPAVDPHVSHHGDAVGACAAEPDDGDGGGDTPPPPTGGGDTPPPPATGGGDGTIL